MQENVTEGKSTVRCLISRYGSEQYTGIMEVLAQSVIWGGQISIDCQVYIPTIAPIYVAILGGPYIMP
jgi:hypothetical protein